MNVAAVLCSEPRVVKLTAETRLSTSPSQVAREKSAASLTDRNPNRGHRPRAGRHASQHPGLQARYDVLVCISGLGPVTVMAMLIDMPELGSLEANQPANLSGLTCDATVRRMAGQERHPRRPRSDLAGHLYARPRCHPLQPAAQGKIPRASRRRKTSQGRHRCDHAQARHHRKRPAARSAKLNTPTRMTKTDTLTIRLQTESLGDGEGQCANCRHHPVCRRAPMAVQRASD